MLLRARTAHSPARHRRHLAALSALKRPPVNLTKSHVISFGPLARDTNFLGEQKKTIHYCLPNYPVAIPYPRPTKLDADFVPNALDLELSLNILTAIYPFLMCLVV